MLTYYIWTNKYYSRKDYKEYTFCRVYPYKFRLFVCILLTLFAIPVDLIAWPLELIFWLVQTFLDM